MSPLGVTRIDHVSVIITDVARASPAERRGVFRGAKLTQVNDVRINTTDDVRRALESVNPGEIVSLHVEDYTGASRVFNVRMPQ